MNDRDRLIELLNDVGRNVLQFNTDNFIESLADHLISNDVIVPPCKVGDVVCRIDENSNIFSMTVFKVSLTEKGLEISVVCPDFIERCHNCKLSIDYCAQRYPLSDFGKTVFLTREEAERELKERE